MLPANQSVTASEEDLDEGGDLFWSFFNSTFHPENNRRAHRQSGSTQNLNTPSSQNTLNTTDYASHSPLRNSCSGIFNFSFYFFWF
jgi:hypothetical protein